MGPFLGGFYFYAQTLQTMTKGCCNDGQWTTDGRQTRSDHYSSLEPLAKVS